MSIEIRGDNVTEPLGGLDEVIGKNVNVHLERMSWEEFALVITDGDRQVIVNLTGAGGHSVNAFVFADERKEEKG